MPWPRVTGGALALAMTAFAAPAAAQEAWTFDLRGGYAAAWSTGVSHLGYGEGLAIGHTWRGGFHLELEGFHFEGERTTAANAAERYLASYSSVALQCGVGWELETGPLRLRPGLELGTAFVSGRTKLGALTWHDDIARPMFGPALAVQVPLLMVRVGVEGQGLFVPTTVAAPTLSLFALVGVDL